MRWLYLITIGFALQWALQNGVPSGECFRTVDTYNEDLYYTVVDGFTFKDDGQEYRGLYVPWGLSWSTQYIYYINTDRD